MSTNKKQFGVWMDSQHATIIGRENNTDDFVVMGNVKSSGASGNSNENAANNQEQGQTTKFFKEITALMQNIDEIEVTGTGQVQEQFIKHLSNTPQYKNVVATESTSNKMSDEKLLEYIAARFN
jgi:stalled ribosome rescue protein Dom34